MTSIDLRAPEPSAEVRPSAQSIDALLTVAVFLCLLSVHIWRTGELTTIGAGLRRAEVNHARLVAMARQLDAVQAQLGAASETIARQRRQVGLAGELACTLRQVAFELPAAAWLEEISWSERGLQIDGHVAEARVAQEFADRLGERVRQVTLRPEADGVAAAPAMQFVLILSGSEHEGEPPAT